MEALKEKETKRRFFRRTGLSRAQRSLDSSSPLSSHSPSLENNSMTASPTVSSTMVVSPHALGGGGGGGGNGGGGSSLSSSRGGGGSLDENVINSKMEQHRRFMAAPRRARSADRFDGMRISFNNSPALGDEMLPRNFRSPQLVRSGGGTPGVSELGGRIPGAAPTPTMSMPSPPPPYSSAVTDITGPPSYRQAVAAMTAAAQAQVKVNHTPSMGSHGGAGVAAGLVTPGGSERGSGISKISSQSQRYAAMHLNRGTQSFDQGGGVAAGLPPSGTLRSAASVPAFSDEVLCNCSKCQVFRKPNDMGYDNDAVYMESQAFLMHEIMTDGMAFCSIM